MGNRVITLTAGSRSLQLRLIRMTQTQLLNLFQAVRGNVTEVVACARSVDSKYHKSGRTVVILQQIRNRGYSATEDHCSRLNQKQVTSAFRNKGFLMLMIVVTQKRTRLDNSILLPCNRRTCPKKHVFFRTWKLFRSKKLESTVVIVEGDRCQYHWQYDFKLTNQKCVSSVFFLSRVISRCKGVSQKKRVF
jgi:hypothetical protein